MAPKLRLLQHLGVDTSRPPSVFSVFLGVIIFVLGLLLLLVRIAQLSPTPRRVLAETLRLIAPIGLMLVGYRFITGSNKYGNDKMRPGPRGY